MPMALPLSASTNPSVSNCRIRRRRLAPSDRRMPISLTRAAARAISRLPMFAHATNQTSSNPAEMADAAANGPTESDRPGPRGEFGPGHDDAARAHAVGQHELAAQEVQFGANLFARSASRQPSGDIDAAGDGRIVRLQLRCRGHGEKQLLSVGGLCAREVAGRDADDRERHLVDANVGADDAPGRRQSDSASNRTPAPRPVARVQVDRRPGRSRVPARRRFPTRRRSSR